MEQERLELGTILHMAADAIAAGAMAITIMRTLAKALCLSDQESSPEGLLVSSKECMQRCKDVDSVLNSRAVLAVSTVGRQALVSPMRAHAPSRTCNTSTFVFSKGSRLLLEVYIGVASRAGAHT